MDGPEPAFAPNEGANSGRRSLLTPFGTLRIFVAVGLLGFLLYRVGLRGVMESFSGTVWWWVVLSILAFVVGIWLETTRWQTLLKEQAVRPPLRSLFKRIWIARFFSSILPGQTGGDLFRIFGSWEMPVQKAAIASSVVFDRITSILGLLVLGAVAGFAQYDLARELGLGFVPVFAVVAASFLGLLVTTKLPWKWLNRVKTKVPGEGPRKLVGEFLDSSVVYVNRRSVVGGAFALGIFRLISALGAYFVFRALGTEVSLRSFLFIWLVIDTISMMPISVNGLGVREAAYVVLFSSLGIKEADVLAVAVLIRVMVTLLSAVGALLLLGSRKPKTETGKAFDQAQQSRS